MILKHNYIADNLIILSIVLLFSISAITACSPYSSPSPSITAYNTRAVSPQPTLLSQEAISTKTATPSSTPISTFTLTIEPTPTLCPSQGIFCDGIEVKEIHGEYHSSTWSPVENRIMFTTDNSFALAGFSAPDFLPQKIPFSQKGFYVPPDKPMIWQQDGRRFFLFAWNANELNELKSEYNTLWYTNATGKTVTPLSLTYTARMPSIEGWMGPNFLAISSYCARRTCLDLLDTRSGTVAASAEFWGAKGRPNDQYVPVMNFHYAAHLLVVGKEKTGLKSGFSDENLEYGKPFSFEGLQPTDSTFFADWLPGTNQMLLSWNSLDNQEARLYLWDIDRDTSKPVVHEGLTGSFSPDGTILAYLTDGRAQLDQNQRPIAGYSRDQKSFKPYLQLLDMTTGQVFGSFPILIKINYDRDFPQYQMDFHFSSDGRYLAFLSDRTIQLDEQGWPVLHNENPAEKSETSLTVLDLFMRKSILFRKGVSSLPSWSPNGHQMVYQDSGNQIVLFNPEGSIETKITRPISTDAKASWSYDGSYLVIEIPSENWESTLGFVKVP